MPSFTPVFNPPSVPIDRLFSRLNINGTSYNDYMDLNVTMTVSENNSAGTFTAVFDNYYGEYASTFNIGQEIIIYYDENISPPITALFAGLIEDINFSDKPDNGKVTLRGRDYSALMQDATVVPIVYTNQEVSTIVTDIISDNCPEITTTNVAVTSTTLQRISFNHLNVFDAIKQLAELSNCIFWVDGNKDLHFVSKSSTSSGVTLDNTNILQANFTETDDGLYNEVWVYGDRILTNWQNSFTANGGSVYTLDYKPHNTEVLVAGSTAPKRGGVFELITTAPSGIDYLVSYNDMKIIFVSGTIAGNNIPASGTTFKVNYDRSTPIVKFAEDSASKTQYKKKVKVIQDKTIKDPNTAKALAIQTLNDSKNTKKSGNLRLSGVFNFTAGQTVVVNLPFDNVNNQVYDLLSCNYDFSKKALMKREVLTVTVSKKLKDFVDTFKQLVLDVKKLQGQDFDNSDVITRLQLATGSVGAKVKQWQFKTASIGSDFYVGSPAVENGWVGSPGSYWVGSHAISYTVVASGGD